MHPSVRRSDLGRGSPLIVPGSVALRRPGQEKADSPHMRGERLMRSPLTFGKGLLQK